MSDEPRDAGITRPRASPNSPASGPTAAALGPLAIALLYAGLGAAWILLSDRALDLLFPAGELQRWQTVKGLLYVAITAVLLYHLTRRSLAAVRRSERLYRQMFETTTVALLLDPDQTRIEDANAAACAFYGWPREELVGRPLSDLNPRPLADIQAAIQRTLAGQRGHFLVQHHVRDGSLRDVEVFSSVVDVGGRRLLYSVVYDRTEARRLEQQLRQAQKLEALGQLTGGIAHDLNNVLSVVLGNAELLGQEMPPDRADLRADLGELTNAARRGAAMIRKLLSFSRSAPLEVVTLDLAVAVGETAATLRRFLPAAIDVSINVPREPLRVRADRGALEQILMNLVTNARDAMPSGGHLQIEVRRRVATDEDPGGEGSASGSLIVRDDGIGMDEPTRARMFEPFFTTKPPPMGTGLGMTMIQALVRQLGAVIAVDSGPGRGTTVTISFPLAAGAAGAVEPVGEAPLPRGTETILVVEDEAPLRRAAARLVERLGYSVRTASDGAEALAILRAEGEAIQLVLSDIVMPRMGGRALHATLRGEGRMVKFLFTSGYGGEDLGDGAGGEVPVLIRKPWSLSELAVKLREVLDA